MSKVPDDIKEKAIAEVLAGASKNAVGKKYGINPGSLHNYIKKIEQGMNEVNESIAENEPELMPVSDNLVGQSTVEIEEKAESSSVGSPVVACFSCHKVQSLVQKIKDFESQPAVSSVASDMFQARIDELNILMNRFETEKDEKQVLIDKLTQEINIMKSSGVSDDKVNSLKDDISRLETEIQSLKILSQKDLDEKNLLENTVYELEGEKASLETKLDESQSLLEACKAENAKRLESGIADNQEAQVWKQKYESLITNGKKQMEDLKKDWMKTNKSLEERAQVAITALNDNLTKQQEFEAEKKILEDEITKMKGSFETKSFGLGLVLITVAVVCLGTLIYLNILPLFKKIIGG